MSVSRTGLSKTDAVNGAAADAPAVVEQFAEKPSDIRSRIELRLPRAAEMHLPKADRQGEANASPPASDVPAALRRTGAGDRSSDMPGSRATSVRQSELGGDAMPADNRGIPGTAGEMRNARLDASPSNRTPAQRASVDLQTEIARYFSGIQEDLKRTIAQDVAREIASLRSEIRKSDAEDRHYATTTREDLANLTDSINQLSRRNENGLASLSPRITEILMMMDGLSQEAALQNIEACWDRIDQQLEAIGGAEMRKEIAVLNDQTKGIERQLEDRLGTIAIATDEIAASVVPANREFAEQMTALSSRLDGLVRTVSAGGRSGLTATETTLMQRLENRICGLTDKIDLMSSEVMLRYQPTSELSAKIDKLADRIDQMAQGEPSASLDARFDALSRQIDRSQKAMPQLEFTRHLATLSKKIDALDQAGAAHDNLTEKLDYLARRIDEIDLNSNGARQGFGEATAERLEGRLTEVAIRLEEFSHLATAEPRSRDGLEHQMSRLAGLLGEAWGEFGAFPAEFDRRMTAMEAFVASNDEFIVEAAHRAAEAVVKSGSLDDVVAEGMSAKTQPAFAALAEDLRHIEDASRVAGERTHRTFEALHDTLIQMAERLMHMEARMSTAAEKQSDIPDDMLEDIIRAELASTLGREKSKSGLLAGLSKRFGPGG
jgi:localization factor PodJL